MKVLMVHVMMRDGCIPIDPFVFCKSFGQYLKTQVTDDVPYDHVRQEEEYGEWV
jgi:hypothetical protein